VVLPPSSGEATEAAAGERGGAEHGGGAESGGSEGGSGAGKMCSVCGLAKTVGEN